MANSADIIIVGGGLAGLVAACEAAERGKKVIIVDQEGELAGERALELVAHRLPPVGRFLD